MPTFLRIVIRITIALAILRVIGQLASRRFNVGDDEADEFSIATIFGGTERASRAAALRRGAVIACCGGVELDLRKATLDPAGADLTVQAWMGGVEIAVPRSWRVTVERDAKAGGIEVQVPANEDLVLDAPALRVRAVARMGGIEITAIG